MAMDMTGRMDIYCPIQKIDPVQRLVYGYASTGALDSQGERVSRDAITDAMPDYMKFGNVREMHQPSAVGIVKTGHVDDTGLFICAKIVDSKAWEKVEEKVYKGFSIGGKRIEKINDTVTKLRLTEISLVDRPANPECTFSLFKADDTDADLSAEGDVAYWLAKKEFSEDKRKALADKGHALPDGSFPIENKSDLQNAVKAVGRAKDKAAAKTHITQRAKDLKATDLLPADWPGSTKEEKAMADIDLKKQAWDDIKKWAAEEVYDVATATQALESIMFLFMKEMQEDGPEAPAQAAALKTVIEGLKTFIASEVQEVSVEMTPMAMAEKLGDLMKAGARNSKTDGEAIQKIHDHSTNLGAKCPDCAEKAEVLTADDIRKMVADEVAKVAKPEETKPEEALATLEGRVNDQGEQIAKLEGNLAAKDEQITKLEGTVAEKDEALAKLEGEKTDLTTKVEELEKMPAPAKGSLKSITKGQDVTGGEPVEEPKTALEAIAKAHQSPHFMNGSNAIQQ